MNRLEMNMCGITFKNPVVVASATPTKNAEYMRKCFESGAGGAVAKSVTDLEAQQQYVRPRFTVLHKKAYPHVFSNYSTEFAATYTPKEWMKELKQAKVYAKDNGAVLIGSVVGTSLKSWRELSLMVEEAGCDMLEINFGCPNLTGLKVQGAEMGADIQGVTERVRSVVEAVEIPVLAKLTSEGVNPLITAGVAKEAGIDGFAVINRTPSLEVDLETGHPLLAGGFCGVGGPWMRPIMLKWVAKVADEYGLPVSATSGIWKWSDVVKAIMCGASTVQTCTAVTHGQKGLDIVKDFIQGLDTYLEDHGYKSVEELKGLTLRHGIKLFEQLERWPKGSIWAEVDDAKCTGCQLCQNWCFYEAISYTDEDLARIDKKACDGCGACAALCPAEAINMKGEKGPIYLGDFG
jgi:dihydroorotate dehydrogenase (fumarate)/dihydropyrimidine dehydrogenase (NAD+) subunit PreA